MSDWQKGDLALCVKGGYIDVGPVVFEALEYPQEGRLYIVQCVVLCDYGDGLEIALQLVDGPRHEDGDTTWWHGRFIKITPGTEITGKEVEKRISIPHLFGIG